MSEFKSFNEQIRKQFNKMVASENPLFRSKRTGRDVWDKYLSSFKQEDDPVFRDPNSTSHTCNNCNNFIRRYGNIVSIDSNGKIVSMFSGISTVEPYQEVAKKLADYIESVEIESVFFETFEELHSLPYERSIKKSQEVFRLGMSKDYKQYTLAESLVFPGVVKEGDIKEFNHFYIDIPKRFVDVSGKSVESIIGGYRDKYSVFKRALEEISSDTLILVKDLINQGSLLDGTSHLHSIDDMLIAKKLYYSTTWIRNNWLWLYSYNITEREAKFKNTLIGVLCCELTEGMELNKACENWNKRVDPVNYHKATAPITQKQITEAQKFVEENGYTESFNRRLATIDDIKVSEIKHINVGDGKIKEVSIFDSVKSTSTQHKRAEFDKLEEISIEKFMKDILPGCTSVEAYLENRMEGNLVNLTTSVNENSKLIFKWANNYSWTFNGNLAGKSQIKEAVKNAGGKVDGVLRFSIMWSGDGVDDSDLDAHCIEPNNHEIYFSDTRSYYTGGNLDIDITRPLSQMPKGAVENINYPSLQKMKDGVYKFFIRQFRATNSKGFKAEIEFNGELYSYEQNTPVYGNVVIAKVTLKNGAFSIDHGLPANSNSIQKELWGIESNNFHKVNLACLSPNHWGENHFGNLHYFFMLDGCKNSNKVRGFHNENLIDDLLQHRKVMEVLGTSAMIDPKGKQLAGLGFNSTVRDELVVKCAGSFKRMLKIKF